ncbi:GIY-YIG nuclease family protein [bacterium]|nr:GIY-YIG nuclease family protein [bacterium]
MHYVYLLQLANTHIYSGLTKNLKRRYYEHQSGKTKSTKDLRPLKLIFFEAYLNKQDAERRERYFKTDKGKKMIRVLLREYFTNLKH